MPEVTDRRKDSVRAEPGMPRLASGRVQAHPSRRHLAADVMTNVLMYWSGQRFDFGNFLAVASAAIHCDGLVELLVDEEPADNHWYELLRGFPGVLVQPFDADAMLPAEHAALYRRMQFVAHRSDLVSFWALARTGGIYLDTDTVTRKPLFGLPPRLLFDDGKVVYVGAMAFPPGDPLPAAMLEDLLRMPDADLGVHQSIVYRWTRLVREMAAPPDFGVLRSFFPVHWKSWEEIFRTPGFTGDTDAIHCLHHYGHFSWAYTCAMDPEWVRTHPCLFSDVALPVVEELERRLGPLDRTRRAS